MPSPDCVVLEDALRWHGAGHRVELFTVVATWGSAPRAPGALLAVRDDGRVSGSVSGGCVEDDLVQRARHAFAIANTQVPVALPTELVYGVTALEAARFGLPCGGSLRLVQEPLRDTAWVKDLLKRIAQQRLVARTLHMGSGAVQLADAVRGQALHFDGATLTSVFGPQWRLLLIGAGQISQAVAHIASILEFEILVCDPREEYAAPQTQTPLWQCIDAMPDDAVRAMQPDAHSAIVALTHDPKLDDMALLEALRSNAFYVGALGSRRNQEKRKQRLAEHFDLQAHELARLHGPVGLALGGKTPAEIAVSIVAELVQSRNAAHAAVAAAGSVQAGAQPA